MSSELTIYSDLLVGIKNRVRQGQIKAYVAVNTELLATYWDIGKMIHERQQAEGWGKGVIPRLAIDLKNELSEVKGFSVRNIQFMIQFYTEYQSITISPLPVSELENTENSITKLSVSQLDTIENLIVQPPVAQLEIIDIQLFNKITWSHHLILMQKIKDLPTRYWYMQQVVEQGWSRDTLVAQIKSNVHERQGTLVHNFDATLPDIHSQWAKSVFKDPYIFDFTTLATEFSERELEVELTKNVEKFLVELGAGFAFVGRQYKLEVSDKDVYLDLLFYHLKTRCFIVIDLKKGDFLPEYAGKMNFYCSAVDDLLKHETDQPTVGLILCQGKDKVFAEYTLRGMTKPIGISEYELTRILPEQFKGSLPSVEEIEEKLNEMGV
ncbi:PDDEXK nuclease domain-containing protein [Flavobacterium sp.]|uniref:PDDEXK nuclease domain-containing protein n=1 Tax=Flavobacterium sp. TaxID=239 RepID=UPI00248A3BD5|nr:PDDEXK nuclease domain-containing protein [Flavobacterium sp.]MDI1317902.1 PDDEXK nuclease domain-containing protein [Flavobacterium sp.]